MPRGGTIIIRIDDAAFEAGALIEISVADTGTGMSEDALAHIFEPLFTTKRSRTRLGLAVSYQIVIAHGGRMYAESQPGSGAVLLCSCPGCNRPAGAKKRGRSIVDRGPGRSARRRR